MNQEAYSWLMWVNVQNPTWYSHPLPQLLDLFMVWDWSTYLADYGQPASKYLRVNPHAALTLLEKWVCSQNTFLVFILDSILHKLWSSQLSQMWWHVPVLRQEDHEFEGPDAVLKTGKGGRGKARLFISLFWWTDDKFRSFLLESFWLYMRGKCFS